MKKIVFVILPIFLFAQNSCDKCYLNKAQIKCDYYVAKNADLSKIDFCKEYASYLREAKAYSKSAWYYLLSKEPKLAIESAKKAIALGQDYALEYLADAYLIEGNRQKAKKYYSRLKKSSSKIDSIVEKNFSILDRLYKEFNKKEAMKFLK